MLIAMQFNLPTKGSFFKLSAFRKRTDFRTYKKMTKSGIKFWSKPRLRFERKKWRVTENVTFE